MRLKITLVLISCLLTQLFFSGCTKTDYRTGLAPINAANDKVTGSAGRDLLVSGTFNQLNIEIQYMTGFAPDPATVSNLTSFLSSLLNKTSGITVLLKEIPAANQASYAINDIAVMEQKNRTVFTSGNVLGVYVLITDGAYSDPSALGIAYRNTSICLLGKTIFDNSPSFGSIDRTQLESTVVEHEFGHLLGLVDLGTPMVTNHKDTAHGNHCNVPGCLMYFLTETSDFFGLLRSGKIPTLDAQCLADLRANGGK